MPAGQAGGGALSALSICDLLLTGVVLHDIGKIHELSYERGFGYTNEGQLLGHIMIAPADGG